MKKLFSAMFLVLVMQVLVVLPVWCIGDGGGADAVGPERFFLNFSGALLIYTPASRALRIETQGNPICMGEDWEIKKVKPWLYHLRLKSWKDFYWKVNSGIKGVYRVTEGHFGRVGGLVDRLNITMEVTGGSPSAPPSRVVVHFPDVRFAYSAASGHLHIEAQDNVISRGKDWKVCNFDGNTFHLKQNSWEGYFWEVTTEKPALHRLSGAATFCHPGTPSAEALDVDVRVER